MFEFVLLASVIVFGVCYFTPVGNGIVVRYQKFRQLNNFVATRYKTISMIVWVSLTIVAKMYWLKILQWANNSIVHNPDKTITLSYSVRGKLYKIVIPLLKGPPRVLLITDENHEDVSDTVMPYMGANQDWHLRVFHPSFWNKETLTFELSNGETKTFGRDEVITV